MPYKNPDKKRAYQRKYMRQRRAGVRPSAEPEPEPVRPHQEQAGPSRFIDQDRPYTIEDRYPHPSYLVQDGYWYHWETGELVGQVQWEVSPLPPWLSLSGKVPSGFTVRKLQSLLSPCLFGIKPVFKTHPLHKKKN
jgi:hypothetical protein